MTAKPQPKPEIDPLDLLPKAEADRRTDALLRRMLATPPDPFTPKPKRKRAKASKPVK